MFIPAAVTVLGMTRILRRRQSQSPNLNPAYTSRSDPCAGAWETPGVQRVGRRLEEWGRMKTEEVVGRWCCGETTGFVWTGSGLEPLRGTGLCGWRPERLAAGALVQPAGRPPKGRGGGER